MLYDLERGELQKDTGQPGTNCGSCLKRILEGSDPENEQPPCAFAPCDVAHLMHEDLDVYLRMFWLLQNETLRGLVPGLLRRAKASDEDIDVFHSLQCVMNGWQSEKMRNS